MHSDLEHIKISLDCPKSDSWSRFLLYQLDSAGKTRLTSFCQCISLTLVRQTGRLSCAFACSLEYTSSFGCLFINEACLRIDGLV